MLDTVDGRAGHNRLHGGRRRPVGLPPGGEVRTTNDLRSQILSHPYGLTQAVPGQLFGTSDVFTTEDAWTGLVMSPSLFIQLAKLCHWLTLIAPNPAGLFSSGAVA